MEQISSNTLINHKTNINKIMSRNADIIKGLREIIKDPNANGNITIGTVTDVDLASRTCYVEPIDEAIPDFIGCRLMTDIETGFLIIPAIDSQVTVMQLGQGDSQVIQFSTIDSIQLNGTDYFGLVQIVPLIEKLNALEIDLNELKVVWSALLTYLATGPGSGAMIGATIAPLLTPYPVIPIIPTLQSELENLKVSHGGT